MARVFDTVDLLLVPSLRDEMLTISNQTGHPSLTLRAGFVEVGQARSDWAPDPARPLPTFSPKRRVPHGVTLIGRLFDEGLLGRVGIALEKAFARRRRAAARLLAAYPRSTNSLRRSSVRSHCCEITSRARRASLEPRRLQLPAALAPLPRVAHEAGLGQDDQVLGDGLARDSGAAR